LINNHHNETGSIKAKNILNNWENEFINFKKIMPRDYKRVLEQRANQVSSKG